MRHEKKILREHLEPILDSRKTYEVRLADWECKPGDVLVLREWNPERKEYTGRVVEKEVTYVGKTKNLLYWPQEDIDRYGFQIIGFH